MPRHYVEKLWELEPTGIWSPVLTQAKDLKAEAKRLTENGLGTFKVAKIRPRKAHLVVGTPTMPAPAAAVSPPPGLPVISPKEVRAKWTASQAFKLARQHHRLEPSETYNILLSLGIDPMTMLVNVPLGPFYDVIDTNIPPSRTTAGTLVIGTKGAGIKVGNEEVECIDIMATGEFVYDLRLLGGSELDTDTQVTDDQYLGGVKILRVVEGINDNEAGPPGVSGLLSELERAIGVAIRNPDPLRAEAVKSKRLESAAKTCPCEECVEARRLAELNGTQPVEEKRKLMAAAEAKQAAQLERTRQPAAIQTPQPATQGMVDKIKEATLRGSHLIVPEKSTVN